MRSNLILPPAVRYWSYESSTVNAIGVSNRNPENEVYPVPLYTLTLSSSSVQGADIIFTSVGGLVVRGSTVVISVAPLAISL